MAADGGGGERLKLGVMARLRDGEPEAALEKVGSLGVPTCQLSTEDVALYTPEMADRVRRASEQHGVEITTLWAHVPGRKVWDFYEGPLTIGLVPDDDREGRLRALLRAAEFASWIGAPSLTTHVGFIPEDPNDPKYDATVQALRRLAERCGEYGLRFWFETGQETPVTLLRTIQDVATDNLGINLDAANLVLYGKANPLDALDVFGRYIEGVHAKDGEYPTDGRQLGTQKALGDGRVDFTVLVPKLKALGYRGALTIEREISGPRQIAEIRRAIELLSPLC